MFGRDPVADAKEAEEQMSGGATEPVPGAAGSLTLGFSPVDVRAFRVESDEFTGKTIEQLFGEHPNAPVLRVVRDGTVIEPADNPTIQKGDVIAVRADVNEMILEGHAIVGPEVDDPVARNIQLEAADLRIGSREMSGHTVEEMDRLVGFGLQLKALFRQGQQSRASWAPNGASSARPSLSAAVRSSIPRSPRSCIWRSP
jgi:putative transport protein